MSEAGNDAAAAFGVIRDAIDAGCRAGNADIAFDGAVPFGFSRPALDRLSVHYDETKPFAGHLTLRLWFRCYDTSQVHSPGPDRNEFRLTLSGPAGVISEFKDGFEQ